MQTLDLHDAAPAGAVLHDSRHYRLAGAAVRRKSFVTFRQFRRISGIDSVYIARTLFDALAEPGAETLTQDRLAFFLTLLDSALPEDKRSAVFNLLKGADDTLTRRQFSKWLYSSLVVLDPEQRKLICAKLTDSIFRDGAGVRDELDASGFADRFGRLSKLPTELASRNVQWLADLLRPQSHSLMFQWLGAPHRRQLLLWSSGYLALCVLVFAMQAIRYRLNGADLAIQLARGAAGCVNLGTALVSLPMLHSLTTQLHRWLPSFLLPFGSLRSLHKLIGVSLIPFSLVHIAGQMTHQALLGNSLTQFLFCTMLGLTGVALLAAIGIMGALGRQRFYRKPGRYPWFKGSHKLYWLWFGLMLWHSPRFWAWFLLPGALFAANRYWQARRKCQLSCVLGMQPAAERITILSLKRPKGFKFCAGDYVYIRIPEIDAHQWHPFTLSSAPGDDQLTLHIRNAGHWTGKLHALALEHGGAALPLPAEIDGPYSAPSAVALRNDVTILVAGGIGVTPFASLLQHIALQALSGKQAVKRHLYCYWVCRSPGAVAWIRPLLDALADSPAADRVTVQIHCGGVRRDLSDLALRLASEHYFVMNGRDAATGCRYPLHWGRPNWADELDAIRARHPGATPRLFFCGPTAFSAELKQLCLPRKIPFAQEIF